jgi:phage shock protein PspC (stress-responsive transcriptional regulator)
MARFCPVCGNVIAGFPNTGYSPFAPRLVRPLYGRWIGGVCAGLARTYGWDIGWVRTLAVISGLFLCPFPEIFYIACWIGMPEESFGEIPPPPPPPM